VQKNDAAVLVEPVSGLVLTYLLLVPMLYFSAGNGFSFDHLNSNNPVAHMGNLLIETGAGSAYSRLEKLIVNLMILLPIVSLLGPIRRKLFSRPNAALLMLPAWALLSTAWSQAPASSITAAIYVVILMFLGAYLSIRFNPDRQLSFILFVGCIVIAFSLVLVAFYPAAGIEHFDGNGAWQGMFPHKQHCGAVMTYFLVTPFCMRATGAVKRIALSCSVLLSCLLLLMSQSRTGWLMALCVLVFLGCANVSRKLGQGERWIWAAILLMAGFAAIAFAAANMSEISWLLGKEPTLSGRTRIWDAIIPTLFKRPWLGYGYTAFWIGMKGESANVEIASNYMGFANPESAAFGMWLDLGAVGVLLMGWMLFQSCKNAVICMWKRPSGYVTWCSSIVLLHLLALVDGDPIMYPHTIEWLLFVMAFLGLSDEARRAQGAVANVKAG